MVGVSHYHRQQCVEVGYGGQPVLGPCDATLGVAGDLLLTVSVRA